MTISARSEGSNALPVRPRAPHPWEADRLANALAAPTEQLIVWTLLDTGLCVGEMCALTPRGVLW